MAALIAIAFAIYSDITLTRCIPGSFSAVVLVQRESEIGVRPTEAASNNLPRGRTFKCGLITLFIFLHDSGSDITPCLDNCALKMLFHRFNRCF